MPHGNLKRTVGLWMAAALVMGNTEVDCHAGDERAAVAETPLEVVKS